MAATVSEKASPCEAVSEPDGSASRSAAASSSSSSSSSAAADESADGAASSSAAASESEDGPEPPVAATASSEGASEPDASASSSAASAAGDSDEDGRGSSPEPAATAKASPSAAVSESDGSASSSASSSGDGSTQSSEDGSGSKPGSAATAKVAPSKVVETFDVGASQTLAEHAASHNFPMHVRTCGPCRFWKHRVKWSVSCSAKNPVTLKKETWLGHAGGGSGVCLFCAAYKGRLCLSDFGRGVASLCRIQNIQRHAKCQEHREAEAAWKERVRAEGSHQGAETFSEAATAAPAAPVFVRKSDLQSGGRAVVATRALLETCSSFKSFDVWRDALLGDERAAVESSFQCRQLVSTMALHEKLVTQKLLKEGVVFRLSADGLDRTYQVEIGTVLWSLPKALDFLPSYGKNAGWLEQLGPKGPWVVERLIGMREFPGAMDCDGKATMLEDCVRRACQTAGGELDVVLHKHVREELRAWCSDGADLGVPLAATATFPRLAFHAWDESHSAQALLKNSMKEDAEITTTDSLLVTRKKPPSLAKFLSTSTVFRNRVGLQQQGQDIAFVKNFGWAPQRFNSRARPLARESQRWDIIFKALGEESQGSNQDRRLLARGFLEGLGGENSSRLLLGGLLADLCAEHYSWLATGDKSNPDAATVEARAAVFLSRLDTLFMEGAILGMPDSFTGVTLRFLQGTSRYPCGVGVQIVGLGDLKTEAVRDTVKAALRRVKTIVANAKENMKLYRPENSWLHAFTAFRLPSPLSATDAGATEAATEAEACLRRICQDASLPEEKAIAQLRRLLKRAEWHQRDGCTTRQAWGRAAAEWPELHIGRRLVELFFIWKTSSGNVERRFRRLAELRCPERARLLDTSVEECSLVDQAPPSKLLRTWLEQQRTEPGEAHGAHSTARRWFRRVLQLHERFQARAERRLRPRGATRRDKGIEREPRPDRRTEAGFGRKRAAAIDAMVAASPSKRLRILAESAPDLAALALGAAQGSGADPVGAAAKVVASVAKREGKARERYLGGAKAAAKARSKREKKVLRSAAPGPAGRDAYLATARPGLMLVRLGDQDARLKAQRLRFKLVYDPVDFLAILAKQDRKAARKSGNVVLAATADTVTDFGIAAQITAAFTGAFFTTPTDFARQDSPQGIQYPEKLRSSTTTYHVAVTADLQADLPTLPLLLRTLAQAPSGCVKLYLKPEKLCKFFKKHAKGTPRLLQRTCVLCRPGEEKDAKKGCKQLYISPKNWLLRFKASVEALCPGTKAVAEA